MPGRNVVPRRLGRRVRTGRPVVDLFGAVRSIRRRALTNQSLAADAAWERSRLCGRVVDVVKEKLGEVTGEAPRGEPRSGHMVQTNEPTGGA